MQIYITVTKKASSSIKTTVATDNIVAIDVNVTMVADNIFTALIIDIFATTMITLL
mgnify:CR=1 FL=1